MLYRVDKTLFSLVFKLSTSTSPQLTSFSSSDHICHYFNLFCFFLSVPVRFLLQNFQSLLWLIFLFLFSVSTSSFTLLLCLHFPSSSLHSALVSFQFYYLFYAFHPLTLLYCTLSLATSHTPFAPPFPLFPVFLSCFPAYQLPLSPPLLCCPFLPPLAIPDVTLWPLGSLVKRDHRHMCIQMCVCALLCVHTYVWIWLCVLVRTHNISVCVCIMQQCMWVCARVCCINTSHWSEQDPWQSSSLRTIWPTPDAPSPKQKLTPY